MATVTLLQLKQDFWSHQNQRWQSTLTGGSTTSAVDTTLTDIISDTYPTAVANRQIRITSGASSGDLRQIARPDFIRGAMFPSQGFSSTGPTAGDTYDLWGNGIHGGLVLTNLFNDVGRRLRPITRDQVTIVTGQEIYDISTLDLTRDDVINVWDRLVDTANIMPYTNREHSWWTAWEIAGSISGGTSTLILQIKPALTAANNISLWVEHYTALPSFSSDTDTLDAKYRDWIVWEAILTYCDRNLENTSTDHKTWEMRKARAIKELMTLRQRWVPLRPITIRPQAPV